jgi:hypothetical protein
MATPSTDIFKEYANTPNEIYSRAGYGNLAGLNNVARYSCNNVLDKDNISSAKRAYEKLYSIYTTTTNKSTEVNDTMCPREFCNKVITGTDTATYNCPHNVASSNSNLIAYTEGENGARNSLFVSDLKFYLDDCGARIRNYDNDSKTTDASYKQVKTEAINFRDNQYNSLVKKRSDLDNKMNEILGNNKNSILYEKQSELDASVYSTLLWTVMVTSLLYYVFTKI